MLSHGLWQVHTAFDRRTSMSLAFTDSAISSSFVHNLFVTTAWIRSSIAFAWGFLTLVGLRFTPCVLHRAQKWSLNLRPFLHIMYQQWGYLLNQVLYTRLLICVEDLSKVVNATLVFPANVTFLLLPMVGTVINLATVGSSTISNQLVAGLIIVRHMKSILEPFSPLRV